MIRISEVAVVLMCAASASGGACAGFVLASVMAYGKVADLETRVKDLEVALARTNEKDIRMVADQG